MYMYDTFFRRLVAILLDTLVFFPFLFFDVPEEYLLVWEFAYVFLWTVYATISHGRYGMTLGKRFMNLKVLDVDQQKVIGYWRAFLRELIWLCISVLVILRFINFGELSVNDYQLTFDDVYGIVAFCYILIEVIVILSNNKRRSIDDYVAKSVVIYKNPNLPPR